MERALFVPDWHTIVCDGAWSQYKDVGPRVIGVERRSEPSAVSRPRPRPIWSNPTDWGPFETYYEHRGHWRFQSFGERNRCVGNTGTCTSDREIGFPNPVPPYLPPWENELAARVKDLRVNIASDLAEYREAVECYSILSKKLWYAAKELARCVRRRRGCTAAFRGLFTANARRTHLGLGDVSSAWLLDSYGIAPTLGTLNDILLKIGHADFEPPVKRISFTTQGEELSSSDRMISDPWLFQPVNVREQTSCRIEQRVIAYVIPSWHDVIGQTITPGNPAEWIWEMIPFSFVIDWLIPIGDHLTLLDAYSGISSVRGTVTTRATSWAIRTPDTFSRNWGQTCKCCIPMTGFGTVLSPGKMRSRNYHRERFVSAPGIKLGAFWEPSQSWRPLANATALLHQLRDFNLR
jgi:hypothetical protein